MENAGKNYERLGARTFYVLFLKRANIFFVLLALFIGFLVFKNYIPEQFGYISQYVIWGGLAVAAILLAVALGTARLEYSHYSIYLAADMLKVKRGVFVEEEVGIPYRRIQEVKIQREINDQAFGVSTLFITLLGEEEGTPLTDKSRIVLPYIPAEIALEIQDALLKKAEVEEMAVENK